MAARTGRGPGGDRGIASEDDEARHYLGLLRDGSRDQKIAARFGLAAIFERRGMLDEAAELCEANIYAGVRDPELYRPLAGVHKQRGDAELAYEVRLEADRLRRAQETVVAPLPPPRHAPADRPHPSDDTTPTIPSRAIPRQRSPLRVRPLRRAPACRRPLASGCRRPV
jgi:hypothetical protein